MAGLLRLFPPAMKWLVKDLEVLGPSNAALADLFGRVEKGPAAVATSQLLEAIENADQVVTLIADAEGSSGTSMTVEDGEYINLTVSILSK